MLLFSCSLSQRSETIITTELVDVGWVFGFCVEGAIKNDGGFAGVENEKIKKKIKRFSSSPQFDR